MPKRVGYGNKRMRATPKTNPEKKNASDRSVKGAMSKTRPGDKDYTTKRGDKDYHRGGKDVKPKKGKKPFMKKKK